VATEEMNFGRGNRGYTKEELVVMCMGVLCEQRTHLSGPARKVETHSSCISSYAVTHSVQHNHNAAREVHTNGMHRTCRLHRTALALYPADQTISTLQQAGTCCRVVQRHNDNRIAVILDYMSLQQEQLMLPSHAPGGVMLSANVPRCLAINALQRVGAGCRA
jgi:hypothetical protein